MVLPHSLKNIDVTLPAGKLAIITGVSGSGRSSLAFDTIYAEGQRRVRSLSACARQFLERMEKPDVDRIEGICPAIAIGRKTASAIPARRSARRPGYTTTCGCIRTRRADVLPAMQQKSFGKRLKSSRSVWAICHPARVLIGFELPVVSMSAASPASDAETAERSSACTPEPSPRPVDPIAAALDAATARLRPTVDRWAGCELRRDRPRVAQVANGARSGRRSHPDRRRPAAGSRFVETSYREGGGAAHRRPVLMATQAAGVLRRFAEWCWHRLQTPQPRLFSFNNPFGRLSDVSRLATSPSST